jgi:ATP-binding cassette subfamily C protein
MAFAGALTLFITLLHLVVPLFMLQVDDRVLGSRSMSTLISLGVIAITAILAFGLLSYIRARVHHIVGNSLFARLNLDVLHAAVADVSQGGETGVEQAVRDLNDVRSFVSGSSIVVCLELFWSPMFLVVSYLLHPAFLLFGIVAALTMVVLGLASRLLTRRPLEAAATAATSAYRDMDGTVRNAEVIEAMGMLGPLAARWEVDHQRMAVELDRANRVGKAFHSASAAARMAMQVLVLAFGAYLVIDGQITPGAMIAASILTARFLQPYERVIDTWQEWTRGTAAFARLRKILAQRAASPREMKLPRPEGRLSVENLTYVPAGSDRPVLANVSFALEPGEVLGIIGPTAAGKSSLARAVVGVIQPTAGGAYLDGHSTYLWEREDFGSYVGYLPQSSSLLAGTVRQNIARMADAEPYGVVEAARKAGIHDMIGRLPHGYETRVGDSGYTLSGGQRQRLALARALYEDPVLLVLDEPNASLDYDGEIALDRAIRQAKANGVSTVIVAHRPSGVAQADKLLLLRNGRVEMFDAKDAVLEAMRTNKQRDEVRASLSTSRPRLVIEND